MIKHDYKIEKRWLDDILYNNKRFEIRKDDRPIRPEKGDLIFLTDEEKNTIAVKVIYVLDSKMSPSHVPEGYFIFGFERSIDNDLRAVVRQVVREEEAEK
jgi:ASCH domain.